MIMEPDTQQRIEAYLSRLRARLRGMNGENTREIVEELRAHIIDKAAASGDVTASGVEAALAALGSPEELASQYMTDDLLARVEVSRSPLSILRSLFRWASLSVVGFFVLLGSMVGYVLGSSLILCALLKPFHPRSAGLWASRDSTGDLLLSIRLGFGSAPASGRDVLGWWIVPIGLLVGSGLVIATTRIALWCVRLYRRSRVWPRG
jgi:Protein of unknown function (DUF1700)